MANTGNETPNYFLNTKLKVAFRINKAVEYNLRQKGNNSKNLTRAQCVIGDIDMHRATR
jgi:hypothetical protein